MKRKLFILTTLLLSSFNVFSAEAYYLEQEEAHLEQQQNDLDLLQLLEGLEAQFETQEVQRMPELEAPQLKQDLQALEMPAKRAREQNDLRKSKGVERLFGCPYCEKDFSGKVGAKASLSKHIKNSHPDETPARTSICQICGKGFAKNQHLKAHIERAHNKP